MDNNLLKPIQFYAIFLIPCYILNYKIIVTLSYVVFETNVEWVRNLWNLK